jgi:membrane-bound lytic murein transglycosylase F
MLTRSARVRYAADLEEIRRRGVLRVLTRNNSSSYFIARGRQLGFSYELARAFADELGVRVRVVVPNERAGLIPALLRGEGDLVAAGMTATEARAELVRFTPPLFEERRVVVTHRHVVKRLDTVEGLGGFELAIDPRSTTAAMLRALAPRVPAPLRVLEVPSDVEMEEMIRRVGTGEYEATVADETLVRLEQAAGAPVRTRLKLDGSLPKAWALRPSSRALSEAADDFVRRHARDGLIRIVWHKYFEPEARHARRAQDLEFRADRDGMLSPYDALFRREGARVNVDWRLLASVAYSESRFDPRAESRFGAAGLMQLMPSTARRYARARGSDEAVRRRLLDPAYSVRIGARYLRWLLGQFEDPAISADDTVRLALAAYNVGIGHVKDARELALRVGLDPDRWSGVEEALRMKKDPRWHEMTKYGYCRAEQPIAYVTRVLARYQAYVQHVAY